MKRSTALFRFVMLLVTAWYIPLLGCGSGQVQATTPPSTPPAAPALWLPKTGDLRFQGLGAYTYSQRYLNTDIYGGNALSFPKLAGSPLQLGSGACGPVMVPSDCFWFFSVNAPATLVTTAAYGSGYWNNFDSDLPSLFGGNTVITSLDIQIAWNTYATSRVVSSIDSNYHGQHAHITSATLSSAIAGLTASGQVVTALAPDSADGFQVFSYGWGGDTNSKYESVVLTSSIADVGTTFQQLASQGYILTALGGTRASGMRLVGTRLVGQTQGRPAIVAVDGKGLTTNDPLTRGYVFVGFVFDDLLGNTNTWLMEH